MLVSIILVGYEGFYTGSAGVEDVFENHSCTGLYESFYTGGSEGVYVSSLDLGVSVPLTGRVRFGFKGLGVQARV